MCPKAAGANVKYAYLDHDTDLVDVSPPVLNQWYTVFDAYDVRLLWCLVEHINTTPQNETIEIRFTIDGTVYFGSQNAVTTTEYWVYRGTYQSAGGTGGLLVSAAQVNGACYVDKRGQHFKVEVRISSALGANQRLICRCVRETLEQT
jgi:hypothetical protein